MKNVAGAWGVWQNATALSYPISARSKHRFDVSYRTRGLNGGASFARRERPQDQASACVPHPACCEACRRRRTACPRSAAPPISGQGDCRFRSVTSRFDRLSVTLSSACTAALKQRQPELVEGEAERVLSPMRNRTARAHHCRIPAVAPSAGASRFRAK
jgi:hypothetical protein